MQPNFYCVDWATTLSWESNWNYCQIDWKDSDCFWLVSLSLINTIAVILGIYGSEFNNYANLGLNFKIRVETNDQMSSLWIQI